MLEGQTAGDAAMGVRSQEREPGAGRAGLPIAEKPRTWSRWRCRGIRDAPSTSLRAERRVARLTNL